MFRRRVTSCPTCPSRLGERHAPWCGLVRVAARSSSPYVVDADVECAPCGCSAILVDQLGGTGHRADCGRPSAPRPTAAVPPAALPAAGMLMWAAGAWLLDLAPAVRDAGDNGLMLAAAVLLNLVPPIACAAAIVGLVLAFRPNEWPGQRVYDGGEPGRLVRCEPCGGDGLLVEMAYGYPPTVPSPEPPGPDR